jgi:hypothetical protein
MTKKGQFNMRFLAGLIIFFMSLASMIAMVTMTNENIDQATLPYLGLALVGLLVGMLVIGWAVMSKR